MVAYAIVVPPPKRQPRPTRKAFIRESEPLHTLWDRVMWFASSLGGGILPPGNCGAERTINESFLVCFRDPSARDEFGHRFYGEFRSSGFPILLYSADIELAGDDPKAFYDCIDPEKGPSTL